MDRGLTVVVAGSLSGVEPGGRMTPFTAGRTPANTSARSGFTLIELILVMALLTIAVSMTAPTLSRFFRGRALDSEARQLLSLARHGQSRAVSEGLPVDLWVDSDGGKVGLAVEPGFETDQNGDPRRVELELDASVHIEASAARMVSTNTMSRTHVLNVASVPKVTLVRANLPTLRFLPDGTLGESSPLSLHLTHRDGGSLWLTQTRNRLSYEIRDTER